MIAEFGLRIADLETTPIRAPTDFREDNDGDEVFRNP